MKFIVGKDLDTAKQLLVLGWFSDKKDYYKDLNPLVHKKILDSLSNKSFKEKEYSVLRIMGHDSVYDEILVISLGSSKDLSVERVRRVLSRAVNHCKSLRIRGFTTNVADLASVLSVEKLGLACGESILLSNYSFNKYKESSKDDVFVEGVSFSWRDAKSLKKFNDFLVKGSLIGEGTNFARDLINEPANVMNPEYFEVEARKLAKNSLVSLKVFNQKDLEKLGMNLILAVGRGSVCPPRLLVLDYKGSSKKPDYVFVGKGITFDTGGYNIKPTGFMEDMKCDMSGAAAVLGTLKTLTLLKSKLSASFVIPLAENMVSSKAYRPGDIIKAHNGKTVEILNTDAEGRLILADALSYASQKYKGSSFIDIATLTGAAVIATGYFVAPMMGNNQELLSKLKSAGDNSNDSVWEFPFGVDYQDNMDSDIADLANISRKYNREGGSITAGVFLSKFVNNENWVHVDIAGTAFLKEKHFYNPKYATGAGVRLFTYLLNNF